MFTCVLIGGSNQNLQELLDFDSVLLIFWFESENKSVISLLLLHRFKSFESSFSLLLNFSSAIALEFATTSGEFALEL